MLLRIPLVAKDPQSSRHSSSHERTRLPFLPDEHFVTMDSLFESVFAWDVIASFRAALPLRPSPDELQQENPFSSSFSFLEQSVSTFRI